MSPLLITSLAGAFLAVALLSGGITWAMLERQAPGRRRLLDPALERRLTPVIAGAQGQALANQPTHVVQRIASFVPKSPSEINRLRRRLIRAGYHSLTAAVVFSVAELVVPVVVGLPFLFLLAWPLGIFVAAFGGVIGFLLPGVVLARLIEKRRQAISNGLPDVLDLLIVCLEAGCSLDQAVVKASEELALAYPALGDELKMLSTETRAGKPRIEAFKNFEARTKNDDVRSLVAMLVQTDRFGTSVSQALRTFAEVSRTKRRQRAEERAAKVGVKMVFPLVLFLFPALYVVTLGAAAIKIIEVFFYQMQ